MPACLRLSIDETIVTWRSCSALFFSMAAAAKVVVTTRVVADAKNIFTGSKLHGDDSATVQVVINAALEKAALKANRGLIFVSVEAGQTEE